MLHKALPLAENSDASASKQHRLEAKDRTVRMRTPLEDAPVIPQPHLIGRQEF